MIKIEFPADRMDMAEHIGRALLNISRHIEEEVEPLRPPPPSLFDGPTDETRNADSAVEAGAAIGIAQTAEPDSSTPTETDAPVDPNGVAFDAGYCGKAKDPFYATGKRAGQWKKRKGISDGVYDAWYEDQLAGIGPPPDYSEPQVDTASAFGAPATDQVPTPSAPKTMGDFMVWVSEQQAAGTLNQLQINEAYGRAGMTPNDLFQGSPAEIESRIAALYNILSAG